MCLVLPTEERTQPGPVGILFRRPAACSARRDAAVPGQRLGFPVPVLVLPQGRALRTKDRLVHESPRDLRSARQTQAAAVWLARLSRRQLAVEDATGRFSPWRALEAQPATLQLQGRGCPSVRGDGR